MTKEEKEELIATLMDRIKKVDESHWLNNAEALTAIAQAVRALISLEKTDNNEEDT